MYLGTKGVAIYSLLFVIPAKAGIHKNESKQYNPAFMDSRLRGNDVWEDLEIATSPRAINRRDSSR
jgi:hypothetical protein